MVNRRTKNVRDAKAEKTNEYEKKARAEKAQADEEKARAEIKTEYERRKKEFTIIIGNYGEIEFVGYPKTATATRNIISEILLGLYYIEKWMLPHFLFKNDLGANLLVLHIIKYWILMNTEYDENRKPINTEYDENRTLIIKGALKNAASLILVRSILISEEIMEKFGKVQIDIDEEEKESFDSEELKRMVEELYVSGMGLKETFMSEDEKDKMKQQLLEGSEKCCGKRVWKMLDENLKKIFTECFKPPSHFN